MALIVKYKFQNVDANGNSVSLLPQFPSGVSYTKTDVVEGNITTRTVETDDLSKVTYIRFGCNEDAYVTGAWEYLTEILDINISYVNTFHRMFRGCEILNKIDVSNWNTKNVTSTSYMFNACSQLTQLDLSNWDTKNVTSMGYMFDNCLHLTQLDVSNWDTSNVEGMVGMFNRCPQLAQLDLSGWDTSKVTNMWGMFNGCKQLTQLDISNFDTSNVENMGKMFYGCSKLTQLDVSNFDTSNATDMTYMFYNCSKLAQLDVSNFDTSNVTSMNGMFHSCINLTQLDVSNFNTSNVTSMNAMFNNCQSLTSLDMSNFDTSKVTSMNDMFEDCRVKNVGLIYCSKDTIDNLASYIDSPCNFYVSNETYTSPTSLVKYVIYREDKKPLLYYNPTTDTWEKPVLRQWDSIEEHTDGKYYYHKRSGEVVLNGSEEWVLDVTQENTCRYRVRNEDIKNSAKLITDRFMFRGNLAHGDYEYIFMNDALNLYININNSKLSSQNAQGFKTWLQANPTTVVYQLAEEKVYECINLDLITYENETNFIVNTGAITLKSTLKVMCNITNVVRELQQKVSNLENYIQHVMIDALNNALNE